MGKTFCALALLSLLSCSRGGSGGAAVDPNPAPFPSGTPVAINMNGRWEVTQTIVSEGEGSTPTPLPDGCVISVVNNQAYAFVNAPGEAARPLSYQNLAASLGGLDWYVNEVLPSTGSFGFGYDRLDLGGSSATPGFLQYGIRVAAQSNTMMTAYEAERRQTDARSPRSQWVAWHVLTRTGD